MSLTILTPLSVAAAGADSSDGRPAGLQVEVTHQRGQYLAFRGGENVQLVQHVRGSSEAHLEGAGAPLLARPVRGLCTAVASAAPGRGGAAATVRVHNGWRDHQSGSQTVVAATGADRCGRVNSTPATGRGSEQGHRGWVTGSRRKRRGHGQVAAAQLVEQLVIDRRLVHAGTLEPPAPKAASTGVHSRPLAVDGSQPRQSRRLGQGRTLGATSLTR